MPYILQPTRVTQHSKTIIDNIFINNSEYNTLSGNLTLTRSDDLTQFLLIKEFKTPKKIQKNDKLETSIILIKLSSQKNLIKLTGML